MNATLASPILDDREFAGQKKPDIITVRRPVGFLSVFLLPAAALLVGLLPIIYLGLAGLIGWGVWEYVALIHGSFPSLPGFLRVSAALLPVVPAVILVALLFLPLCAVRKRRSVGYRVSREDQPLLVSFVHRLADATGAPRPATIELDCGPAIRVARRRRRLRKSEFVAVIGMPVISKLSLQSFGGALVRELGPLSHPATSRLVGFIRQICTAFERMADWKSGLESWIETVLEIASRSGAEPISRIRKWIVLPCLRAVRISIILVRLLLAGFAGAGRAVSAFVLRRFELQADVFHTGLAGSENFGETIGHLARLEAAWTVARDRLVSLVEENRLSRNFPNLVLHLSGALAREPATAVREGLSGSSGWMEFRPSTGERIRAADRRADAGTGIFSPEKPASSLFRGPDSLGEIVTRHWYRSEWNIDADQFELVSNQALNRSSALADRQIEKAGTFFGEGLDPFRPIFPARDVLEAFSGLPRVPTAEIPRLFEAEVETHRELLDRFDELVEARFNAVEFHQLALTGYAIEQGASGREESDPDPLNCIIEFLDSQLLQVSMKLGPFEERCNRLIAVALGNLGDAGQVTAAKLDNRFYHLAVVEQVYSAVPELQDLTTRLEALIRRRPDSDLSGQCGERFDIHMRICELLKRVEDYLGSLSYPFDDYGEDVTMWDYLTADMGTRHEAVVHSGNMARAVTRRLGDFYLRNMGQLAMDLDREEDDDESEFEDSASDSR